jgi:endonuclease YncB( thermonuclease family)
MISNAYDSIYGHTEQILDGDTISVRHVTGYWIVLEVQEPWKQRSLVEDTLIIRLYRVNCPDLAKPKKEKSQPFALSQGSRGFPRPPGLSPNGQNYCAS